MFLHVDMVTIAQYLVGTSILGLFIHCTCCSRKYISENVLGTAFDCVTVQRNEEATLYFICNNTELFFQ